MISKEYIKSMMNIENISILIYISLIIAYVLLINDISKKHLIYGSNYEINKQLIDETTIFTYPYKLSDVPSLLKIIFMNPLYIYIVCISIYLYNISNISFIKSLIINYGIISILLLIHAISYKIIHNDEQYEEKYRPHFVTIILLSPIIIFIYFKIISMIKS